MNFVNENTAINGLADYIARCAACLYNSIKYIYSLGENDFYNVSIKDVLKVILNNIPNADSLKALGLKIDGYTCGEMNSEAYNKVLNLMLYSFAVRIPVLKSVRNGDEMMTDDQLYRLYNAVIDKGAENIGEIISETYLEMKYLVRKGKKLPPFTADWYKSYIYTSVPTLTEITNKNMFLLGFVDVLFAMFYSCMEDGLSARILEYSEGAEDLPPDDDEL